jgi:hypothetical protein
MSGDPQGNDSDKPADVDYGLRLAVDANKARNSNSDNYSAKGLFGQDQERDPVYNNSGQQVGYTSDPSMPSAAIAALTILNDGVMPQVYTGDSRYDPFSVGGGDDGDGNNAQNNAAAMRQAELATARQRRAAALGGKQNSLAEAFGVFNNDFYDDLGSSYSDFQNPLLTQGYDASLRGIYDGFKAKGLLKQSEVDAAIAGLDTSRAAEMERIGQGASEYTQAKRDEVAKRQSALGDQLASMVGGATTAADVDAQTAAIEAFDFSKDIDKLKTPGAKGGLNFFQNYNQMAATADPSVNVAAQSTIGDPQTGSITPVNRTGISSPFGSNSIRVV